MFPKVLRYALICVVSLMLSFMRKILVLESWSLLESWLDMVAWSFDFEYFLLWALDRFENVRRRTCGLFVLFLNQFVAASVDCSFVTVVLPIGVFVGWLSFEYAFVLLLYMFRFFGWRVFGGFLVVLVIVVAVVLVFVICLVFLLSTNCFRFCD
jgi:hypothetical protein